MGRGKLLSVDQGAQLVLLHIQGISQVKIANKWNVKHCCSFRQNYEGTRKQNPILIEMIKQDWEDS